MACFAAKQKYSEISEHFANSPSWAIFISSFLQQASGA
jgi:hypothetical protein